MTIAVDLGRKATKPTNQPRWPTNGRYLSISAVVVTLTQSFLIRFLPNFIYALLPSTFRSSLNMGFVRHLIIKMADKMAATCQCPLSWSLSNLVIFYRISSKFHVWIASIKLLFKIQYKFSPKIVIALSVRPSVRRCVRPCVRPASCPVHISYIL